MAADSTVILSDGGAENSPEPHRVRSVFKLYLFATVCVAREHGIMLSVMSVHLSAHYERALKIMKTDVVSFWVNWMFVPTD